MKKLVEDYIAAWNRQDVADILAQMHSGAAYYDAFWMETCVGKDLINYLQDSVDEEDYWYQQIGDIIETQNGATFRYSAHERSNSTIGPAIYYGAEVLIVRDNKILTVSDYYCSPDRTALQEIAELAAKRHGLPSHTKSGLGALKALRVRAGLSTSIELDKSYRDSNLTLSRLAENIGCSVDYLSQVIDKEFGADFDAFLDNHRVKYAKALLEEGSNNPDYLLRVATEAGFKSLEELTRSFVEYFGVTPEEFRGRNEETGDSADNLSAH